MGKAVRSFCFGLTSLKKGCIIICYILLVTSFLLSLFYSYDTDYQYYYGEGFVINGAGLVMSIIVIIISSSAIYGLYNGNVSSVFPVMIWTLLMLIYAIIGLICTILWGFRNNNEASRTWIIFILEIVIIVVDLYFFLVLYSYFTMESDELVLQLPTVTNRRLDR